MGPIFNDSDWVRDTTTFGYTYPDLDRVGDRRAIWSEVCYIYIWSIRSASNNRFYTPPSEMMPLNLSPYPRLGRTP